MSRNIAVTHINIRASRSATNTHTRTHTFAHYHLHPVSITVQCCEMKDEPVNFTREEHSYRQRRPIDASELIIRCSPSKILLCELMEELLQHEERN